jgi:hypothetical protein
MELLLRNLDKDLSEEHLEIELAPLMKSLGAADWDCHKPRKGTRGTITFLRESDGEQFIAKYGARLRESPAQPRGHPPSGRERDIPCLRLLHKSVFVYKGSRPIDNKLLDYLRHRRDQAAAKPANHEPREQSFGFPVTEVSCGHNMFLTNGQIPTFIRQTGIQTAARATIGRRLFVAVFPDGSRMHIDNEAVMSWIANDDRSTLTLVLSEAPRFYKELSPSGAPFNNNHKFERCLSLPCWAPHSRYVASCLVYQMSLHPARFDGLVAKLRSIESISYMSWPLPVQMAPVPYEQDYTTAWERFDTLLNAAERVNTVSYPIRFLLHRLVSNSYLHPSTACKLFAKMETRFSQAAEAQSHKVPITTLSMKHLFDTLPFACPGVDASQLDADVLFQEILGAVQDFHGDGSSSDNVYGSTLRDNQFWQFRAVVTPSNIRLEGPERGSKNRVMRRFANRTEFFLRVLFCDENGQSPEFVPNVSNEALFNRYRRVFREGVRVAGRQFSFLGFSHSSLRSHAAWFCAPFHDDRGCLQSHVTILRELGDFARIRVPARCAARIGQAFSETPFAVLLSQSGIRVEFIPDIKSADGSRVFSDGIGTISREALAAVCRFLPKSAAGSTCLQIRLGGVKGMLTLDATLPGRIIYVRKESMMKFPSDSMDELGICDMASRPLRMYLNRQLIKIMEDMGSDARWFIDQMRQAVDTLRDVLNTPSKVGRFIASQGIGSPLSFPWFLKQLHNMGIDFRRDGFLRSIVEHAVLRELRLLKYQARIPVAQGVTLFGVMDEYGYLGPNEIYVAYDEPAQTTPDSYRPCPREGRVLVTRSPALHPGDVRIVQHVTPPVDHPLRALRNCVIFSQKGERDLPSQLSGGDLDGDTFSVIWDPRALHASNFDAADYPRVVSESLDRDVTQNDIAEFFVTFMETDILGVIAVRHQIVADIEPLGTRDSACIKLAEMHSAAVDYSKSGKPVQLSELGKAPRTRPDFLAPAPPVQLYESTEDNASFGFLDEEGEDEGGLGRLKARYHRLC